VIKVAGGEWRVASGEVVGLWGLRSIFMAMGVSSMALVVGVAWGA